MDKDLITSESGGSIDITESDIMMVAMIGLIIMTMYQFLAPMTRFTQSLSYHGVADPHILRATSTMQWLDVRDNAYNAPWISAFFINDGPGPVEIGINYPDDRLIVNPLETRTIRRGGAEERISIIFYICEPGRTAAVRVEGEY